jgi:spermidine/putrescine transport system permease protein
MAGSRPSVTEPGRLGAIGLLAPAMLSIVVFLVLPLSLIVAYSFLTKGQYGGVIWTPSSAAYEQLLFERDIFTDAPVFNWSYVEIVLRSAGHAALATLLSALIGIPMAYHIATQPPRMRTILLFLVTMPYWVNLLVRTVSMLFIIRNEGPLSLTLQGLGVISGPLGLAYTNAAIQIGLVYSYLPFMVLPVYAAIERFDFRLLEAANDLYSDRWTALRLVILPSVAPGIVAGCLLVFIPCIGAYIAPDLLGGGKVLMIGNTIAMQFQGSRNWPFGAALSVVLMVLVMILLLVMARTARRSSGRAAA